MLQEQSHGLFRATIELVSGHWERSSVLLQFPLALTADQSAQDGHSRRLCDEGATLPTGDTCGALATANSISDVLSSDKLAECGGISESMRHMRHMRSACLRYMYRYTFTRTHARVHPGTRPLQLHER